MVKRRERNKRRCEKYFNCINPPLITTAEGDTFLDMIPPPELHLMLGVVNTIFTQMLKECEKESLAWANACHVHREISGRMSAFKGNACKQLLDKIHILRGYKNLAILKYVQVFDDFRKVVSGCFGNKLEPNYKTNIQIFKNNFDALGIKITPKVHAVYFHVEQFCDKYETGLGYFSEQAMESVHFDFSKTWETNKVAPTHSNYSEKLLSAVCRYNGLHI